MQPLSRNQRPDLLTSLMNMSLVLRLPPKMSHACHRFFGNATKPSRFAHFWQSAQFSCACYAKRHLNVQKCSEPVSFFALLTSKCASRHNGVQWFIPHLATCPTRRFSEPTFRPSGATNHWKKTVKPRLFYLFLHLHLLSPRLFLFSDLLSSSLLFFSLLLSDSSHLCFSICPYCRKF